MIHTIEEAHRAILRLARVKGKKRAALIERMMRHETGHFTSGQFKKTGSAGMEAGKWKNLPSGASGTIPMRDNHTKQMRNFIVWADVYNFCIYLSDYIDRYNGDWGRWNSLDPSTKYSYKVKVDRIRNRWIVDDSFSTKIEAVEDNINKWGYDKLINPAKKFFSPKKNVSTKVGDRAFQKVSNDIKYEPIKPHEAPKMSIKEVKEVPAAGIWSIIKFVADQYSLSQTINDATLSSTQGSLLNFIDKVVQKPWLQFFGTTIGNKYYFYSRKEPFDLKGWLKLPTVAYIRESDILADDLNWYSGDVYSWYQLTPRGNFYTEQHLQFGYISAVFFEEYADIWGSKPMSQISNYVAFYKLPHEEKAIMHKKAMLDLQYMVESTCYLPFTREGSITIVGNLGIKAGFLIELESTQEIYYVDSVSHNYRIGEDGTSFTTTIQISRGMKKKYIIQKKDENTLSYFNIINFETTYDRVQGVNEEYKKPVVKWRVNRKVFDFFLNKKQNG